MIDKKILTFGVFDPLHAGHEHFLTEARSLGSHLQVIVARDQTIRDFKNREPFQTEDLRLSAVKKLASVDLVLLGDADPQSYSLLKKLPYHVLVLGYDQTPGDKEVRDLMDGLGREEVEIVRLAAFQPDKFKSTFLRSPS